MESGQSHHHLLRQLELHTILQFQTDQSIAQLYLGSFAGYDWFNLALPVQLSSEVLDEMDFKKGDRTM
ncbi:hypothetical protein scyTo_0008397 [Scyliorhinus torazame]|uniref:Uncharacterized protein n=1 Tax=Scyliorhinus torazame TaxID=75743 RepID=A0A401P8S3_SCYTO|nr:hypothetical protein [Scyliorhinus torazame]